MILSKLISKKYHYFLCINRDTLHTIFQQIEHTKQKVESEEAELNGTEASLQSRREVLVCTSLLNLADWPPGDQGLNQHENLPIHI